MPIESDKSISIPRSLEEGQNLNGQKLGQNVLNNKMASSPTARTCLCILILISIITYPREGLVNNDDVTIGRVWYFGWITAICTGFGAIPLIFLQQPNTYILGGASGIAAGMMMSASFGLLAQGISESGGDSYKQLRTLIGISVGWVFLHLAKTMIEKYNISVGFNDVNRKSFKKLVLVVFVMTLHSFSEGVAIGVSFAVHNIPEGLAIALVMIPCGVSFLDTFLWAIFTSIPQPLIAVPAFLFVEKFEPLLILGLGFAGGAMLFVAVKELIPDAIEKLPIEAALSVTTLSFGIMTFIQWEALNII